MSDEVEWVDAPPRRWAPRRKPIMTPEQVEALRSRPWKWARTRTFPSPAAAHQARKRWADNPFECSPDEFEIECRKHGDNTSSVYARFVGCEPPDDEIGKRAPDLEPDGESAASLAGDTDDTGGLDGPSPQEPAPEPTASRPGLEPFKDPGRAERKTGGQAPVDDRTCPVCGDVLPTVAGMRTHRGRKHKGQLAGLDDGRGGTLTSDQVAPPKLADHSPEQAKSEDDNVGPCGPCRRGRCQFCSGAGCKCDRADHFARARSA